MKNFKILFGALAVAMLAVSCSQDENVPTNGEVLTGTETYASFSFKVANQAGTRAAMTTQVADETTVANGRMLIFDEATGLLINNEAIVSNTDLTIKTTSGSRRIFVVMGVDAANPLINAALTGLAVNTARLSDFYALMTDGQYTGGVDTDMGAGFKELLKNGAMVMSNVADINAVKTLNPGISKEESAAAADEEPAKNSFKFNVHRAVAKGNLKIQLKETELETADGIFQLSNAAKYGVRNVNRATLYVQQFGNDDLNFDPATAHSSETSPRTQSAFYNVFDAMTTAQLESTATYAPYYFGGYAIKEADANGATITVSPTAATPGNTVYFSENSNNLQVRGNSTYFGITTQVLGIEADEIAATFSYDAGLSQIATTAEAAAYDNTSGTASFWYLREIPADIYTMLQGKIRRAFTNEDVAFEAMAAVIKASAQVALTSAGFTDNTFTAAALKAVYAGATLNATDMDIVYKYLGKYESGRSYYRLNIYETTDSDVRRHLVRRNHFYNATVTSFATIGEPNESDLDKDPEIPVDSDVTNVTANIEVVDWTNVNMSDDL